MNVQQYHHAAEADARVHPNAIHAVVVMTDGRDESSRATLDEALTSLGGNREGDVKVFTIAYGDNADPKVLAQIAEAGGKRISTGGALARAAIGALVRAGREMQEQGSFGWAAGATPGAEVGKLLR